MSALSALDVSKNFGGVQALSNITLDVPQGERRVIIGPNGAGKTTFFNMLTGTFPVSGGRITLFGQDITRLAANERANLGLARTFQITNLFGRLSVTDNLILALQAGTPGAFSLFRRMRANKSLFQRAEELLDHWQLSDIASFPAREISYGQQRQVDLMLAMSRDPKVLLLDEPMAGLSAAEVVRVAGMIHGLPREMTILMIEHDMDIAFDLADRINVFHQGQMIVEGSADEIRAHPQVNEIYLGAD